MTNRPKSLRVVVDSDTTPLPMDEANELFRNEFHAARAAYADLLAALGGWQVRQLFEPGRSFTASQIAAIRGAAREIAERSRELEAHMDACVDTTKRAERFAEESR